MHSSRMLTVRSTDRILGGRSAARGVSAPGGVCSQGVCVCYRGVSALGGGVCSWGGVCSRGYLLGGCLLWQGLLLGRMSAPGGVSALGGCLLPGGLSALGGVYSGGCGIPACTEADTLTPCGQTDACKNITFATSLRTVTKTVF